MFCIVLGADTGAGVVVAHDVAGDLDLQHFLQAPDVLVNDEVVRYVLAKFNSNAGWRTRLEGNRSPVEWNVGKMDLEGPVETLSFPWFFKKCREFSLRSKQT